jgi:catechol 2,3-dioxygenase-like lactoylglutathione lyase family enzyme
MPHVTGIGETALYVTDLDRSVRFYQQLFAFTKIASDDRFCALRVNDQQVFLLFKKGGTLKPIRIPGGTIPPHDGQGQFHMAFTIPAAEWSEWQNQLTAHGVAIESTVEWGHGARSLYFRDPDDHLIELATSGVWSGD